MGIGDELMAAGDCQRLAGDSKRCYAIWDRRTNVQRWHEVWAGNPHVAARGQPFVDKVYNGPGHRPYIAEKGEIRWQWREYQPVPAILRLTDAELEYAKLTRGKVLIQPSTKMGASPNKNWGIQQWQRLVKEMPHVPWLQVGDGHEQRAGCQFVATPSFRTACGALAGARAAILQEGGLHHAAAALGVPTVVIFGGFISPKVTGYPMQQNLFHHTTQYPLGCGTRHRCEHCAEAMFTFTPQVVRRYVEEVMSCTATPKT